MLVTELIATTCRAIAFLALAFALATAASTASAMQSVQTPEVQVHGTSDDVLLRSFWECDYTTTIRLMDSSEAAMCSLLNEELKVRWFEGDFELMQIWWAQNKAAEHQKIADRTGGNLG